MWNEHNCVVGWTFLALPFSGIGMKTDFSSPMATAEFSKYAGILSAALLTASYFRILNSSAGMPPLPIPLFTAMLPKAHLTSHFRMSSLGKWPHHCGYLSLKPLWISSIYSCHFLISSASVRSLLFLSFIGKNNRIGRTRDLFKKIGDIRGIFHARMGPIKDRNKLYPYLMYKIDICISYSYLKGFKIFMLCS